MLQLAHKKLDVYGVCLNLLQEVYLLTKQFPKEEQYVLTSQLRRAVLSVCSNLAEGSARFSKAEKKRFYEIARSSLVEVDAQIEVSLILRYLEKNQISKFEQYQLSAFRMMSKMIDKLQ